MQLIRFGEKGSEKPGVLLENGERKDCSAHFEDWNADFFRQGGLGQLEALVASRGASLPSAPAEARWGACVARPGNLIGIGLNYADHAKESGIEIPTEPVVFLKASNTVAGPFDAITLPRGSVKTDWEVELGVVLACDALYLDSLEAAEACIAGYCVSHDVSEREFQFEHGGQWTKGKSAPGFNPLGPFLLTRDMLPDTSDLALELTVDGEVRQQGSTKSMIFNPVFIVHYLSQFMQIEAGDVITTGTPPGVGLGRKPPLYLKPGDTVALSVTGLGRQEQRVEAWKAG